MIGNQDYNFKPNRYKIDSNGCWIWLLYIDEDGYGKSWDRIQKKSRPAHIIYYEEKYGKVLEGLLLDHLCRVRCCVNPDHLEAVTQLVNVQRGKRAIRKPNVAILTEDEVNGIRLMLNAKMKQSKIGKYYEVSQGTISQINIGKTWKIDQNAKG